MHSVVRAIALIVLVAAGATAAGDATRAEIASHRALYTLSLGHAAISSDIAELEGRMEYRVVRTCDGWTSEQRTVMRLVNGAGNEMLIDTRYTGRESLDGRHLRFEQQTRINSEMVEELRGEATNGPEGGDVRYEKPEAMTRSLPAGILFPMRHADQVIARARAGDMQIMAVIFEPSTLDSPFDASAVITPLAASREVPGLTKVAEKWKVRIAYFRLGARDPGPTVEVGMALRADGIAPAFEWDYGAYAVEGELSAIELLAPEGC